MDNLSKQVVLTAIGFFVLGILWFSSGLQGSSNKLKAHYFGSIIELSPIELRYIDEQKRNKSAGPKLFVYLTDSNEIHLRLVSLKELKIGNLVVCKKFGDYCYYTESNNVFPYIPTIKFVKFACGFLFVITSIFTVIFRHKIANKVQRNQKDT
ncbi:hypothetical protein QWY77_13875 [Thalassotalea ponticola]|uniref:hypothetical protein n=1 Tax=Thalassotalea ponticola TaxID=1523392 RepID=UPI0025B5221E|nr:hypothetical protein [Thalassotalea ponticola]MDN3653830.1 hypothetical protein [Thalassotalea ponticola]